ncbi:MAG: hypothetical protein IT434_06220 [Phycisphaerales bacterium]|jgi:protein-S-isoprenylcysteine O-methyltransferase Ste14|nr:hypothetical protein [Phycisphaerales bacterium]
MAQHVEKHNESSSTRGRWIYLAVMSVLALLGGAGVWTKFTMPPSPARGNSFLTTSICIAAVGAWALVWELLKTGKGRRERSGTD